MQVICHVAGITARGASRMTQTFGATLRFLMCQNYIYCIACKTSHTCIMIQRSLLRQSRVLCSIPPVRRIDQISHSFPQPIRIPLLSARSAPRCYSTTVEAEGASKAETSGAEAASSDAKADDSTSTELESKNREIIELKVRLP